MRASAACWLWASVSSNYWLCHESGGVTPTIELSGCRRHFAKFHESSCLFPPKCFPNHRLTKNAAANSQRNDGCSTWQWVTVGIATQRGAGSCFYPVTRPELWPVDLYCRELRWECNLSEQPVTPDCNCRPLQWLELQTNLHEEFTVTDMAPTTAFSWLKVFTSAFKFKTLC